MIKNIAVVFLILCAYVAFAEEPEPIILDSVEVSAERQKQRGNEISGNYMEKTGVQDLQQALRSVPGVTLSEGNARGESSFSIRGFDSSYIPIIVDGISVTSPFNGRGDSGSLLIGDMESILIQKGYSSMMMGANGMGGAVLLTVAKPKKGFELYLRDSLEMDSRFSLSANNLVASVGTKQDLFYLKATIQYRDVDHTRLPDNYTPMQGSVQNKGKRLYSDSDDFKTTVIAGITPTSDLDVWATYIYQSSDRGMNPPEVGPVYSLQGWDDWEHQSISLHSNYETDKLGVNLLVFYDTHDNILSSYSSFIHVDADRPNRITEYNEYATGASLNAGYIINEKNSLRGALTFRQDDHWGYRNDLVDRNDVHVKENKISLGMEYEYQPARKLRLAVSGGFDSLLPDTYWSRANVFAEYMQVSSYKIDAEDQWLLAGQAGVFYEFIENHELRLTYARRNQFPTMSDRYSTRVSETLPNPSLKPEVADHVELGYKGIFFNSLNVDIAGYYSHVNDKMAVIKVPDPFNSSHSAEFTTNLDAVSFYGLELSSTYFFSHWLDMGVNLSWSDYSIDKSVTDAKTMTYYPAFTLNSYVEILPWEDYISIMPVFEYMGERWTDTYGTGSLDAYYLLHLFLAFNITDNLRIDMSVRNIMDELYETRYNYPMPGRTYSMGLTVRF